jgi:phosphoglucosamine mutase
MPTRKYFGTDGIRGKVGEFPITPDFMLKLGWAVGKVFSQKKQAKVLIGKDTRISGYMFESALEAGLAAAGVNVLLVGPIPTPGIAYLTRTFHADAGIVVSASHNPYEDNGVKFFSSEGKKLSDEIELLIEAKLDEAMHTVSSKQLGKALRIDDAAGRYIEFCKGSIDIHTTFHNKKIVLDCANGATYHIAPMVFQELGADVVVLSAKPNGLNINDRCGATHIEPLQKAVLAEKADLGIAFDGDGDRVILVDSDGRGYDGDDIVFMIASDLQTQKKLKGSVVGTVMTNMGIEKAFTEKGIDLIRTKVGDRFVMEALEKVGAVIGGESSGHVIHLGKNTTGDGIIAALQILEIMQRTGSSLQSLCQGIQKWTQVMHNVKLSKKIDLSAESIQAKVRACEKKLGTQGRVLLRASGTEPVIRVMVEAQKAEDAHAMVSELSHCIETVL